MCGYLVVNWGPYVQHPVQESVVQAHIGSIVLVVGSVCSACVVVCLCVCVCVCGRLVVVVCWAGDAAFAVCLCRPQCRNIRWKVYRHIAEGARGEASMGRQLG